jgi:pimeloyl-ACP methyl ester carboxylesterase
MKKYVFLGFVLCAVVLIAQLSYSEGSQV